MEAFCNLVDFFFFNPLHPIMYKIILALTSNKI